MCIHTQISLSREREVCVWVCLHTHTLYIYYLLICRPLRFQLFSIMLTHSCSTALPLSIRVLITYSWYHPVCFSPLHLLWHGSQPPPHTHACSHFFLIAKKMCTYFQQRPPSLLFHALLFLPPLTCLFPARCLLMALLLPALALAELVRLAFLVLQPRQVWNVEMSFTFWPRTSVGEPQVAPTFRLSLSSHLKNRRRNY